MKYLELLSPAKDYESGVAAINHGADAVYIGAEKFGAREKAGNSVGEITKLIEYAHFFNAKVYVTVNTIIYENELKDVENLITEIYQAGADAIIIQDLGILEMNIPSIPIFASTQMHNNTSEKIQFLQDAGFKRVILPRELSLDEIKSINSKTNIDLEFFVHGALCVCYSGQCYLSQAITGRSANRGACAQPCRSSYDLIDAEGKVLVKNKHLLSLKDLNLSEYLSDLLNAGITSFKIEGRLKDIDYVKNVTAHYNELLNNFIDQNPNYKRASSGKCELNFKPDPSKSFNRGFTNHFITGRGKNQSSMVTQKSIGKSIGKVKLISEKWFTLEGGEKIANGDGLCFIDQKEELSGIRVNKVDGDKIYPFGSFGIAKGVEVFRNFDVEFHRILSANSSIRLIDCKIDITKTGDILVFSVVDEDNIEVEAKVEGVVELAKNPDKAFRTIKTQLAKTGDSFFRVTHVEIKEKQSFFLQISALNSIRRELFNKLAGKRLANYKRIEANIIKNKLPYPTKNLDYKGNIANSLSKKFYKEHGVELVNEAFELKPVSGSDLMTTRYCIKYELGICPSKQDAKPTGKLYLRQNKKLYLLDFDCINCVMKVKSAKNINR